MDDSKVQVDIGLHKALIETTSVLHTEVVPKFRRALDDVHEGMNLMIAFGGLGVCLYAASRVLHVCYWVCDEREMGKGEEGAEEKETTGKKGEKMKRWKKQVVALSAGVVVVGGICYVGLRGVKEGMRRERK